MPKYELTLAPHVLAAIQAATKGFASISTSFEQTSAPKPRAKGFTYERR